MDAMKYVVGPDINSIVKYIKDNFPNSSWSRAHDFGEFHPREAKSVVGLANWSDFMITLNPYIVDTFSGDNVLVVSEFEGKLVGQYLSAHVDYERTKDILNSGEFWSSVGEDWVR